MSRKRVFDFCAGVPSVYVPKCISFLRTHHVSDIRGLLMKEDDTVHYSVHVDFMVLLDHDVELGHATVSFFDMVLPSFQEALLTLQGSVLEAEKKEFEKQKEANVSLLNVLSDVPNMKVKHLCHIRVFNLSLGKETYKSSISSLRSTDAGQYICISGTVIRTGVSKMLEHEREFECVKCKTRFRLFSVLGSKNISTPTECEGKLFGHSCTSKQFLYLEGSRVCRDYQELRLQERVSSLTMGSIPRSINIILKDDLVDICVAGEDVQVCGVIRHIWKPSSLIDQARCELELVMEAFSLTTNADRVNRVGSFETEDRVEFEKIWKADSSLKTRNRFLKSACPQLYGLYLPKLSVLLTVIGGVASNINGMRIRGGIALLIC